MAAPSSLLCFTILCLASLLCHGKQPIHLNHDKLLFVFGDSLFDPGNNQYISNSSMSRGGYYYPYGMTFHNYSTGRVSDGLLVPDLIALKANLPITRPYLQPGVNFDYGASFASAGSSVIDSPFATGVMNLRAQVNCFKKVAESMAKKLGDTAAKKILMRSVFLFSTGGNDYNGFKTPSATAREMQEFQRTVIGNTSDVLKELYGIGARKFAFQNVGPMGCYPMAKQMHPQVNGKCVNAAQAIAGLHNKALPNALHKLEKKLPGFKFAVLDYFHALLDRINNPTKYGFKEGKVACCGAGSFKARGCNGSNVCSNPNDYVLFDGMHHTEKTNRQLAQLLWSGTGAITGPYNAKQLFQMD